MPTLTKSRSTTPAEAFDLASMRVLNDHPQLALLVAQRSALRHRLTEVTSGLKAAYRELRTAEQTEGWTAPAEARAIRRRITEFEDEAGRIEGELRPLNDTFAQAEAGASDEVKRALAMQGQPVAQAFLAALEQLADASTVYTAFARQAQRLIGTPLVYPGIVDPGLPNRITQAKRALERLNNIRSGTGA